MTIFSGFADRLSPREMVVFLEAPGGEGRPTYGRALVDEIFCAGLREQLAEARSGGAAVRRDAPQLHWGFDAPFSERPNTAGGVVVTPEGDFYFALEVPGVGRVCTEAIPLARLIEAKGKAEKEVFCCLSPELLESIERDEGWVGTR